jgi:hypothetical protein
MLHASIMAAARRQRSGEYVRVPSLEEQIDREHGLAAASADVSRDRDRDRDTSRDTLGDLLDVPATVVCAYCGDADCSGCENDLSRSGIVSVVAWERPATPALSRLWSTARSTTRDAEGFFELLPDGPLMPALRFAAACELLATGAAFMGFVALAAVIAPDWLKSLALDPGSRSVALRVIVLGLPAFAALLVTAHVAHGLSINFGATRSGVRSARTRALRFGLYACGWDLVMGPIGAVVVAWKEGLSAAAALGGSLNGLPTRATKAFLRGCYRLDGERARRALNASYLGAILATLVFTAIVVVVIAVVLLS